MFLKLSVSLSTDTNVPKKSSQSQPCCQSTTQFSTDQKTRLSTQTLPDTTSLFQVSEREVSERGVWEREREKESKWYKQVSQILASEFLYLSTDSVDYCRSLFLRGRDRDLENYYILYMFSYHRSLDWGFQLRKYKTAIWEKHTTVKKRLQQENGDLQYDVHIVWQCKS